MKVLVLLHRWVPTRSPSCLWNRPGAPAGLGVRNLVSSPCIRPVLPFWSLPTASSSPLATRAPWRWTGGRATSGPSLWGKKERGISDKGVRDWDDLIRTSTKVYPHVRSLLGNEQLSVWGYSVEEEQTMRSAKDFFQWRTQGDEEEVTVKPHTRYKLCFQGW